MASAQGSSVSVVPVAEKMVINQLRYPGTVSSLKRAELSSSVSGLVETVHVEPGDSVEKGDLLITLDKEVEIETLRGLKALWDNQKILLEEAVLLYTESKKMHENGHFPAVEFAQRELAVSSHKALLSSAKAHYEKQQALLKRYDVRAPFSGIVEVKSTEVGQWLDSGDHALTLTSMSELRIDAYIPQRQYELLHNKKALRVGLESNKVITLDAKIDKLVPILDKQARTFLVRIKAAELHPSLIPGASVSVLINDPNSQNLGLFIPDNAIVHHPDGGASVFIMKKEGEKSYAQRKLVKLGKEQDNQVRVLSGLNSTDLVIASMVQTLADKQEVQLTNPVSL
ncbi:efflux RND transporter periplasmic adaptor subunit [Pseudoalteromonas tunicata]|uniref:Uncharacterized protein n=2 Tax=Pseudoalteromonas tunicata TaxID=314281 RepID=A4C860_9GAMM|nr:efflux RND transporter periplasmic adaptor subunit [Pseudoalteromonas tunicata]EAR28775.1 hypothetical protein PTD2_07024 [Pseudoalteromonas tunicata D2]